jgi:CubicO group peptidase (beta-lactamase class C family)
MHRPTLTAFALLIAIAALAWSPPRPASAQAVTPEQVTAALAQLDALAQDALARTGVPGMAIAVVYKDEVVYLKGFGVRDTTNPQPVDADTVFQLASLSKPIASTVIAAIVSDGLASWDDPLIMHDPAFQMHDPWVTSQVTLRDMFAHRSGLPGSAGNDLEDIGYDRDAILRRLRYLKPASSFRSTYAYSNFGMTAGGVAAAKAAGQSWEEASAQRLYRPLGMTSTSSRYADYAAASNRARIHVREDGRWAPKFTRDADAWSPAGGASSSARDLAQWVRLQLGKGTVDGRQIITPEVLAQTHLPHIFRGTAPVSGRPSFYGLGWGVEYDAQGRTVLGHAGAFSLGARTQVKLLPEADLGMVVLTNAFPTGVPETITSNFFDLVLEGRLTRDWLPLWDGLYSGLLESFATIGAPYVTPPAPPSAALPLSAYVGTYTNDYAGPIEIVEQGGGLVLLLGPQRKPLPLRHFDRDIFTHEAAPEPPAPRAGVSFLVGPDGTAQSVLLDVFNDSGQGAFTRVPAAR